MIFDNHEEFFSSQGRSDVVLIGEHYSWDVSVDEIYQHFKARLINEIRTTISIPENPS